MLGVYGEGVELQFSHRQESKYNTKMNERRERSLPSTDEQKKNKFWKKPN